MPCQQHGARNHVDYDRRRGTAASRGYDARHRAWRERILARDPLCRYCQRLPSVIADHLLPLEDDGDWSDANGRGACRGCHNRKTVIETMVRRAHGHLTMVLVESIVARVSEEGAGKISGTYGAGTGARCRTNGREMDSEKPNGR